ncbi:MAG: sugar ABC transporter ATP-binding protein, partial [Clostridiales bacterium]
MHIENELSANETQKTILNLKGITKQYGAVLALKKADLTLKRGEIMALLGSNGSGKSTLVKVLSGLVSADEGEIILNSKKVAFANCNDSRKSKIAVAYQDLSLIQEMNVVQNITLGIEAKKKANIIDNNSCNELARKYMDLLKIEVDKETKIKDLLPSTMSLIEIAKAIALEPDILVLDESTASLHSDEVDRLFEVLKELKAKGTSVIMVTHRMNEIFKICDRCTILKSGETVAAGEISDMSIDDIVFYMTGKRPDVSEKDSNREAGQEKKELLLDINKLSSYGLNDVNFKA